MTLVNQRCLLGFCSLFIILISGYIPIVFANVETKTTAADLYHDNCSVCHGDSGAGAVWGGNLLRTPPRNFTITHVNSELSRERMIASVTHGVPGTAMVSFSSQLNNHQIQSIVDYIRNNFMLTDKKKKRIVSTKQPTSHKSQLAAKYFSKMGVIRRQKTLNVGNQAQKRSADMSAIMPGGLKGDSAKGHAFYIQNCSTCHGLKGDGEGPRAYFIFPRPLNFTQHLAKNQFNRPALFKAISIGKQGTEMPAWKMVLSQQEIANISEYVFSEFISK